MVPLSDKFSFPENPEFNVNPETPAMDFLISELHNALALARMGLRADGFFAERMFIKLDCDDVEVEVIPLPLGTFDRVLPFLKSCLEDRGLIVSDIQRHRLTVHGSTHLNQLFH